MFQKKVHYVSQLGSMDCGIACLTMILNYYGCKSDIVDIGAEIQIGRDGMTLAQMKELAEKYGFKFAAYQYNHEEKNLIEYLPAILCNDSHYVVVDKTKKKGKYILFDPANGKRVVDFLELKNGYKDILVSVIPSRNIKKIKKTKFKIEVKFSQFMIAIMLMLMCQLITLAVPMVVQKVIDSLSSAHITIHIWKITLLVLLIMCAHFVLSLLRQKILLNINMKLFKTMISNMIHKIFRLDVSFFEWHSAGDIGNRFNSINQLNDILTNGFINIIIQGITSLVCLAVMTSISPYLTAFVLVVSIIQIAIMILLNGKNLIKTKEYIYSQSTIQGELIDTLENIMEIKCMGMDNAVKSNLQNSYSKLIERFKGKTRISNLMNSFSSTLNLIFPLMIYVIGSYSVKQGGLTIGQLIAYATLVGYFTAPFTKNDEEDGLFRISSRDIVGFYNCSSKQERKITDIIKCYGTTKSIKEVELKNMKPEDNVTVSRYIERNVGSIINKDYVIEGFLGMGKLSDCKDEMVSRLDISKRYCLEILVAFLQEADIIILHEMFENVWNHTIEEILVEFSLRGAVVVFSEHGEESLMKLPMHSYDLSGRCVGW